MADEKEILEQEQEPSAVDIITEMKANTVPKTKYESLQAEHAKLLKALVNGEEVEVEAPEKPNIEELDLSLYTEEVTKLSDVQYIENLLKLREAVLETEGTDIFVSATNAEESDFATAERVAQVLQECLDNSDGNNQLLIAEVQRHLMETNPVASKVKRR